MAHAVHDFFLNGGSKAVIVRVFKDNHSPGGLPPDNASYQTAFEALRKVDIFNLLCLPPYHRNGDVDAAVVQHAAMLCVDRLAFLIVDPRSDWIIPNDVLDSHKGLAALGLTGEAARNAAVFFPRIRKADPRSPSRRRTEIYVPCGAIAGVMARTDSQRGVWKAPAGPNASIKGIHGLRSSLTARESDLLNGRGVNCIRSFPSYGPVVWGANTLCATEPSGEAYRHIPVRRLALFMEESLSRGTRWAASHPNGEPLWSQIRHSIEAFLHNLFRQGAFMGATPREAYFVKCDRETTTQADINSGIVNMLIGFAPHKPAEFVFIKVQQVVGRIQA
jgi:hypothetical protein